MTKQVSKISLQIVAQNFNWKWTTPHRIDLLNTWTRTFSLTNLAQMHWVRLWSCFSPFLSFGLSTQQCFPVRFHVGFLSYFSDICFTFIFLLHASPSLSFGPTFQFLSVCQYILMWRTGGPLFLRLCSHKIANACAVSHNISYSGIDTVLSTFPNTIVRKCAEFFLDIAVLDHLPSKLLGVQNFKGINNFHICFGKFGTYKLSNWLSGSPL